MITQEELDLWISELRSGELRQTRGELTNAANGYCCLGVFCEKVKKYYRFGIGYKSPHDPDRMMTCLAPRQDIAPDRQRVLSTANDNGRTFVEIADFLEDVGLSWVNGPREFGDDELTAVP